jgi:hypothetical protein
MCKFNRPVGWLVFNQPDGVAQPGSPISTGVGPVACGIPSSSQAAGDRDPSPVVSHKSSQAADLLEPSVAPPTLTKSHGEYQERDSV